ncbi:MAG: hypothetical protein HYY16_05295 [Planctomycetes bacterium]|nr:hypothetical protein [Planctomycetota bacterium]
MNILAFDWDGSIGALVRAGLAACGCRVCVEPEPSLARLKLDTALFDALVIGPGGMPAELAEHVETEWPTLPIVFAGVEREVPPAGPVVAVLAKPLCVERLRAAVRAILQRAAADARKHYDMPVDVMVGEQRRACRVVRVSRGSVLLVDDAIARESFDVPRGGTLAICRGEVRVEGDVAFRDRGVIAVRVAPERFAQLEVAHAQGRDDPPNDGGVPDL